MCVSAAVAVDPLIINAAFHVKQTRLVKYVGCFKNSYRQWGNSKESMRMDEQRNFFQEHAGWLIRNKDVTVSTLCCGSHDAKTNTTNWKHNTGKNCQRTNIPAYRQRINITAYRQNKHTRIQTDNKHKRI